MLRTKTAYLMSHGSPFEGESEEAVLVVQTGTDGEIDSGLLSPPAQPRRPQLCSAALLSPLLYTDLAVTS